VRPKPQDHLVRDEQHVVLRKDGLDLLEVGPRRRDHAAGAHHGLGDEGGHGVRVLALDQRVQALRHPRGEGLLTLARAAVAIVVGAIRVAHHGQRQVEIPVRARDPGEAPVSSHT